jgi:hypothetical protein
MEVSADELAGVVDLFGGLTRAELTQGLAELAFKQGEETNPEAFDEDIDAARSTYHLIAVDATDVTASVSAPVLVAGPVAFPELPPGATDLPHILDVDERTIDRETAAAAAQRRFEREAATAISDGDATTMAALLDASYELEAWGGVDLAAARDRLDDATN